MDKDGSKSVAKSEPSDFPKFTCLVEFNILVQDSLLFFWQQKPKHLFEVKLYHEFKIEKIPNMLSLKHSDNDPLPPVHLYENQSCVPRSMIAMHVSIDI